MVLAIVQDSKGSCQSVFATPHASTVSDQPDLSEFLSDERPSSIVLVLERALSQHGKIAELDSVQSKLADHWITTMGMLKQVTETTWCQTIGLPFGLYLAVQEQLNHTGHSENDTPSQEANVQPARRPSLLSLLISCQTGKWAALYKSALHGNDPRYSALGEWDLETCAHILETVELQQSSIAVVSTLLFSMVAVAVPPVQALIPVCCGPDSTSCVAFDLVYILTYGSIFCLGFSVVTTLHVLMAIRQLQICEVPHFMKRTRALTLLPFTALKLGVMMFICCLAIMALTHNLLLDFHFGDFTKYVTFCMMLLFAPLVTLFTMKLVMPMHEARAETLSKNGRVG